MNLHGLKRSKKSMTRLIKETKERIIRFQARLSRAKSKKAEALALALEKKIGQLDCKIEKLRRSKNNCYKRIKVESRNAQILRKKSPRKNIKNRAALGRRDPSRHLKKELLLS